MVTTSLKLNLNLNFTSSVILVTFQWLIAICVWWLLHRPAQIQNVSVSQKVLSDSTGLKCESPSHLFEVFQEPLK